MSTSNIIYFATPGPSLVQDDDVKKLRSELDKLVEKDPALKLAIDCSATHYVSSRALGLLVSVCTGIQDAGGHVVLFGVTPATERVLNVTRLSSVLDVAESKAEAQSMLGGR